MAAYFEFSSFKINHDFSEFNFHYSASRGNGKIYTFTETLKFTNLPRLPLEAQRAKWGKLVNQVAFNLHLMLGISYYKLFCPKDIRIKSGELTKEQVGFWNTVYTKGLGEFFFQNKIDFRDLIQFPFDKTIIQNSNFKIHLQDHVLLGLGGGKDSLVAADLLREHNVSPTAFIIETASQSSLIKEQIAALKLKTIVVKRILDSGLLNGIEGSYNGHVPFSAITAFIGLLTAVLYDHTYIAIGNERSADEGNVEYLGEKINHQWSKSSEFEKLFKDYLHEHITNNVYYFSFTRPLSELKIAELLSKKPEYFKLFSSCNKNFTIKVNKKTFSWCGTCPKCAFTFLLLSAFLPKKEVVDIVVNDLLNDQSLIELYKEMLGVKDAKPFECVGTFDEVKAAFYLVHKRGEFEDAPIMKFFVNNVLPKIKNPEKLVKKELTPDEPSTLPEKFKSIITKLSS